MLNSRVREHKLVTFPGNVRPIVVCVPFKGIETDETTTVATPPALATEASYVTVGTALGNITGTAHHGHVRLI